MKDCDSQNLALPCGPLPESASPVSFDAIALPPTDGQHEKLEESNAHSVKDTDMSVDDSPMPVVHPLGSDEAIQACFRNLQASVNLLAMPS